MRVGGPYIGIPRPRHRGVGFDPRALGTVLSWYRSDQADIATTPGFVESVPDDGTGGGAFAYNGTRPIATKQVADLKTVSRFSDGGASGASLQSSLAASEFNFLHASSGSCTLTIRYYALGVPDADRSLLATQNSGSDVGVDLVIRNDGSSRIVVSAGAGNNAVSTTSTDCAGKGWHTMQIVKEDNTYSYFIDGSVDSSTALGTTSSNDSTHPLTIGSHPNQATSYNGFIAEVVIHDFGLNASQLQQMRDYVEVRWTSVPGVVAYYDADDVTLNGDDVSAWKDQAIGNDLSQPTPGNQPGYVPVWRNGHAALQGGAGLLILRSSFLGGPAYPVMLWSVIETPVWSTTGNRVVARSGDGQLISYFSNSNHRATTYGGTAVVQIADQPTATPMILKSWNDGTEGGVAVIPHGAAEEEATASIGTWHLDGLSVLGEAGVNNFTGLIGSCLVVDHIPSAAGQAEIEAALSNKYNITAI